MFGNNANNDETFIQGKSTSIWDRPDVHIADTLIKGLIKRPYVRVQRLYTNVSKKLVQVYSQLICIDDYACIWY